MPCMIKLHVRRSIRALASASNAFLIAVLSLTPSPDVGVPIPHLDKAVHFVAYGVLSGLVLWTVPCRYRERMVVVVPTLMICIIYGFIIEVLQPLLWPGNRFFSWIDMAANAAGVFASVMAWKVLGGLRETVNGASDGIRTRDIQNHNLVL